MGYKKLENLDEMNDSVDVGFRLSHLLGEIKDFKEPDEFELKEKCRICGV